MKKTRTSVVAVLAVSAIVFGGVAAQAVPPAETSIPMSAETCVSHHPEWSETDREAMVEAMNTGNVAAMATTMGADMAPMMGGGMSHMAMMGGAHSHMGSSR